MAPLLSEWRKRYHRGAPPTPPPEMHVHPQRELITFTLSQTLWYAHSHTGQDEGGISANALRHVRQSLRHVGRSGRKRKAGTSTAASSNIISNSSARAQVAGPALPSAEELMSAMEAPASQHAPDSDSSFHDEDDDDDDDAVGPCLPKVAHTKRLLH
jgi:hypothetical protein